MRTFLGIDRANTAIKSPLADKGNLKTVTMQDLYGLASENLPISRAEAMSIPAVARGRAIITGAIARLPLVVMRGNHPHNDPGIFPNQLDNGRSNFQTLIWTVDALIFYGRAWWLITDRDTFNRPKNIRFIPEWETALNDADELTRAYNQPVNPADVIRIDGPHEGFLNYATTPVRTSLRLANAALTASDSPVPAIELHQTGGTPLTSDEANELISNYAAARKRSGISYTNATIETRTHGAHPENLLIDGRKAVSLEIARALNLPAWALDAPSENSSMNYTNVPARARELLDYTLMPYMEAITARLSMNDILPRGIWLRFNTDPLLFEDFKTRVEAYKTALETGIYTISDLKARELGTPLEPGA